MTERKTRIIWICGLSKDGKSDLRKALQCHDLHTFSTDDFVRDLPNWCDDTEVAQLAKEHYPKRIATFLDRMVKQDKGDYVAKLLLDPNHGFSPRGTVSVIDGYMPFSIQNEVLTRLEDKGFWVWIAMRLDRLKLIGPLERWGRELK